MIRKIIHIDEERATDAAYAQGPVRKEPSAS